MPSSKKKPVAIIDESPPPVKVIRQVEFFEADTLAALKAEINDWLPKLSYNDITEPAVELYYFKDRYIAKAEYDLRIKTRQEAARQTTLKPAG